MTELKQARVSLVEIRPLRFIHVEIHDPYSKNNTTDSKHQLTIFLFHGSMAALTQFSDIISYFKMKCRVVAYDALGCGQSSKPVDPWFFGESHYTCSNLLQDAIQIYEKYSTGHNILIGHSFGSTIVTRILHHYEKLSNTVGEGDDFSNLKIDGVILLGTADTLAKTGHPIFLLPVFILEYLHPMLSAGFADRALSPNIDPHLRDKIVSNTGKNDMHVVRSYYNNFRWANEEEWKTLSRYNHPVLLCQGVDDKLTPHQSGKSLFDNYIQPTIEKSKFVSMENVGHQVMQEQPELIIKEIQSFIHETLQLSHLLCK